jgi:hypothetical protein
MTNTPKGFMKTGLPAWLVVILAVVVLTLVAAIGLGLRQETADLANQPTEIVTRIKDPGTSVFMAKHVQRLKGRDVQTTLTIGGARSDEEPFASYGAATRSEFHWDHHNLIACVEGVVSGKSDWQDHVTLPEGEVQIIKACPVETGAATS